MSPDKADAENKFQSGKSSPFSAKRKAHRTGKPADALGEAWFFPEAASMAAGLVALAGLALDL